MIKKAIITGGAGFIGSNLVNELLNRNYSKVYVFDNFSTGRRKNLNQNINLEIHNIDLKSDYKGWPKLKVSEIFHFAANADVRGGIDNRQIDFEENVFVTKQICDYSLENKIKKVIFSSSATVYGEPDLFPTPEDVKTIQTSVYGASKLSGESYLQAYAEYGYFNAVIFRFVSWIGVGYSHGVIYDFVSKLLQNKDQLEILGDGSQVKSYLDVKDGVRGVVDLSNFVNERSLVFNLGHTEKMNVIKLADIVCDEMGLRNVKYNLGKSNKGWIGDAPFVHLDISRANKYGWHPKVDIETGIRKTVRYLLSDKERLFR